MTRSLLAPALLLALSAGCLGRRASAPVDSPAGDAAPFDVAIVGDMPYVPHPDTAGRGAVVMREYHAVMRAIARSGAVQVVHVGDLTGYHCADSVLALRRAEFDSLPQPLILAVGDNEWVDCGRAGFDPLERLQLVRALFAAGDSSLGGSRIRLRRQSEGARFPEMRENVRWMRGGVLFATLHVVPLPGGYLGDPRLAAEDARRDSANAEWVRESFAAADSVRARGVVMIFQANMGWGRDLRPEFLAIRRALVRAAAAYGGPVVFVHGDSHRCRVDQPVQDDEGRTLPNVTRAETFGDPGHHWLRMRVTPGAGRLFHFVPELVPGNAAQSCMVHGERVSGGGAPPR